MLLMINSEERRKYIHKREDIIYRERAALGPLAHRRNALFGPKPSILQLVLRMCFSPQRNAHFPPPRNALFKHPLRFLKSPPRLHKMHFLRWETTKFAHCEGCPGAPGAWVKSLSVCTVVLDLVLVPPAPQTPPPPRPRPVLRE